MVFKIKIEKTDRNKNCSRVLQVDVETKEEKEAV